jgi:hypothetical protein
VTNVNVPPQCTTSASTVCCLVASSVEFEIPSMVFRWKDFLLLLFCNNISTLLN